MGVTGLLFLRTKGIYLLDVIHIFSVQLRGSHGFFLGLFSYLPKRIILASFFQPQNPDQSDKRLTNAIRWEHFKNL